MKRILGTSKVSTGDKIVLIDVVQDKLGIKKGDLVIFYDEDSKIVIDKAIIEE
jgi:bifunctional DNA-binding transcriptional regulator/antitoxin component of YhaV-PrlF toxin-antitoxin module